ncbi:MAG: DUF2878 domain-containing protein [Geminicoccaceae bacterium]|nr:DUF2878 domain-containing protein [Geminicoccaceae bacterium]
MEKPSRQPSRPHIVVALLLYQAGWFACILGAAQDRPWIGPLAALPVLALHLRWAAVPRAELRLLIAATLIGLVGDSLLATSGLVSFTSGVWIEGLSPLWMVALWPLFATTFNVALRWLRARWLLAAILGALGAPLAYGAGAALGAAVLNEPIAVTLGAIGILWAVATPLLLEMARRNDGIAPASHGE